MRQNFIFVGEDTADMMDAVLRKDEKRIAELEEKFKVNELKEKEYDYGCLKKELPTDTFNAFCAIDGLLKRTSSYSRLMSNRSWEVRRLESYSDDGFYQRDIRVRLRNGKFDIYEDYCDETGYDQGLKMMHENVSPAEIMEILQKLKQPA